MSAADTPYAGRQQNLTGSFALASVVVVVGVLSSWAYLKRSGDSGEDLAALTPPAPRAEAVAAPAEGGDVEALLARAESAYAAGRIIKPPYDNALYFYRTILNARPEHPQALAGTERVAEWLSGKVDQAIAQRDWREARQLSAELAKLRPDADAQARVDRLAQVSELGQRAARFLSAGRLVGSGEDNAAATYRRILELDPGNASAQDGLRSVAQRLIARAQAAMLDGDVERGTSILERARAIDAEAPGLDALAESAEEWHRMARSQRIDEQLEQAGRAIEASRLMPPKEDNAFSLYAGVLETAPDSARARNGLARVRSLLVRRVERHLDADAPDAAAQALALARQAEVAESTLEPLSERLDFVERRIAARNGDFERVVSAGNLEISHRELPEFPRNANEGGWVELEFTVTERGEITDVEVRESSSRVFERPARTALSRWRVEPHRERHGAIPVRAAVRFSFKPS